MVTISDSYGESLTLHLVGHQGWIQGGVRGPGPPRPPKMKPQHQNSTKLRPQNGSFRPVTIWGPPPDQILDPPLDIVSMTLFNMTSLLLCYHIPQLYCMQPFNYSTSSIFNLERYSQIIHLPHLIQQDNQHELN